MPNPPQIAVLGAATPVGRAVLRALAEHEPAPIAVDGTAPPRLPGRVEVKLMDARDRLLPLALEGADVVVHAAFSTDLSASADALYGHNVGATRNVLDAASKAGVAHLVVLSSATVYGAHADNPVPLDEEAPPRANPGFAYGHQRLMVEQMVQEWAQAHPASTVTVLRLAPVLAGPTSPMAAFVAAPRLVVPAGARPLWQFVDVDDVGAAVAHVVGAGLGGTFNVAADGWLSSEEVARIRGVGILRLGQTTYAELLRAGAQAGLAPAPPEALPHLSHPWVLDVSRLRATGWNPTRTNRDVLAAFADQVAGEVVLGTVRIPRPLLRRTVGAAAGLTALVAWRLRRRGR